MTEASPLRRQPGGAYLYDLPGVTSYAAALALMGDLAAARSQGAIPDTLLLCEHEPVITLGTATDEAVELPARALLERRGIAVVQAGRGGKATYHGPGQLVGYPILDLTDHGRDVRAYVQTIEGALVAALADLGVPAVIRGGQELVGVWTTSDRKIASIGIHVARWISTHGFALNVSCDLAPFGLFTPCGLVDAELTSVERETGRTVHRDEATAAVVTRLGEALHRDWQALPMAAA